MKKFIKNRTVWLWTIIYLLTIMLLSCNRNGYGCKGNSKCITRVVKCKPKEYMKKTNAYKVSGDKATYYKHGDHCHRYVSTGWGGTI